MRFRALFGMVSKQLPAAGRRQHRGLQMRVGKLLSHRETIGGISEVFGSRFPSS
jgi:hypothetical protein